MPRIVNRLRAIFGYKINQLDYLQLLPARQDLPAVLVDDLSLLANRYGSDKGTVMPDTNARQGPRLHFTPIYDYFLNPFRNRQISLLEIGIGSGASLRMWSEYFPNASITCFDNERYQSLLSPRINIVRGDQSNRKDLVALASEHGPFDIVIDDGGHMMEQQQVSLGILFPLMNRGGLYFIEDLHTSFWPHGQYKDLYGNPLDIDENRRNTTVRYVQELIRTGRSQSCFLSEDENLDVENALRTPLLFDLPETEYGPNRLALMIRR